MKQTKIFELIIYLVGAKWSAFYRSTPTIRVRIQLKRFFFVFEKNENKQKEAGVSPFKQIKNPHRTKGFPNLYHWYIKH